MESAIQPVHRYRPHGSAVKLWQNREPEVLLSGPAGTGKSRACLEKLHAMALANPGMRGLICRKTAASLGSTALVTFREIVAMEALASAEVKFYHGSAQEAASYRYGNGSVIVVGGMDKSTRIMSSEYDVIYVQEATELNEDDWEALTTRLRNGKVSFQQLMADCNPSAPQHWLKKRADRGQTSLLYCSHEDNPRLYVDGELTTEGTSYIAKLDALTGVRKQRLRYGKWAAAEGIIYDTFDPETHFKRHITWMNPDWPRYWSIDFGYTNPFVWQLWVMNPDGCLILYKEIYRTQTLVEDHAKAISDACKVFSPDPAKPGKTTFRGYEPAPQAVICDHDAEGRATLEKALGISTIAAHKSVLEGIEAVKARLKVQNNGKPRLMFCRDAVVSPDTELTEAGKPTSTAQEILEYTWDSGSAVKERPLKSNDHGMDAMRYVVAHLDLKGSPSIRWV